MLTLTCCFLLLLHTGCCLLSTSPDILLIALGSAGDVHPFVGIGTELRRRGHAVTIVTNPMFQEIVTAANIEFLPVGTREDYLKIIENADLWHPLRAFNLIAQFGFIAPMRPVYEHIRDHYRPGQTIVAATGLALGARIAQEKLGVPLATLQMAPAVFRSVHQTPVLAGSGMTDRTPHFIKRAIYWMIDCLVVDRLMARQVNAFRRELGLTTPARRLMQDWWLSPDRVIGIFPPFFAPPQPDWPAQIRLTSFPLYDGHGFEPVPPQLETFLSAGTPPIVFTLGSANRHALDLFRLGIEACQKINRRAILLSKFPENIPPNLPPSVAHFSYVPLSQLLPRSAALVSHGGIGTVAQGLAAGTPQIVTALAHDQYDNGTRLARLGVGQWRPSKKVTPAWLANALSSLITDPLVANHCGEFQRQLAAHHGISETCDLIEQLDVRQ